MDRRNQGHPRTIDRISSEHLKIKFGKQRCFRKYAPSGLIRRGSRVWNLDAWQCFPMVGIENRYSRLRWDRSSGYGGGNQARDAGQFARLLSELAKFCVELNRVFEIPPLLCGKGTI